MYVTVRTLFGTTINKMFIKFTDNVVCVGDEKNKSEKKKKKLLLMMQSINRGWKTSNTA